MQVYFTDTFSQQLKRLSRKYRHIRADIQPLIDQLLAGETPGDQIQGTGHPVYKVRVANSDAQRGKSGGYRIIYYLQRQNGILLITIYSKTEQSDIEPNDIIQIIQEED